jgi:hypothetical protein
VGDTWTNQGTTRVKCLPCGMPRRLKFDVDQSVIDTCHMCHVTVRSTPVGPSPGVVGTHPPTHHPPPARVFLGSSPGVRKFHSCFGKFPGRSGKFRVFLGSSGCFWKVPRVFWGSSGTFSEVPGCFRSCRVLGPKKHVLRSFVCKKFRSKAKTRNFRPMFHAEPAGIRSWSSEPAVIRSRRLEI